MSGQNRIPASSIEEGNARTARLGAPQPVPGLDHRAALTRYFVERFRKAPPQSREERSETSATKPPGCHAATSRSAVTAAKKHEFQKSLLRQTEFPDSTVIAAVDQQRRSRTKRLIQGRAENKTNCVRVRETSATSKTVSQNSQPGPVTEPADSLATLEEAHNRTAEDVLRRRLDRLHETLKGRHQQRVDMVVKSNWSTTRGGVLRDLSNEPLIHRVWQSGKNRQGLLTSPTPSSARSDLSSSSSSQSVTSQKAKSGPSEPDTSNCRSDDEEDFRPSSRSSRPNELTGSVVQRDVKNAETEGTAEDEFDDSLILKTKEVLERCGELRGSMAESIIRHADTWKTNLADHAVYDVPGATPSTKSLAMGMETASMTVQTTHAEVLRRNPQDVIEELRRRYGLSEGSQPASDGRMANAPVGVGCSRGCEIKTSAASMRSGRQNAALFASLTIPSYHYIRSEVGPAHNISYGDYSLPPDIWQLAPNGSQNSGHGLSHQQTTQVHAERSEEPFVDCSSMCRAEGESEMAGLPAWELKQPQISCQKDEKHHCLSVRTTVSGGALPPASNCRRSRPLPNASSSPLDVLVNFSVLPESLPPSVPFGNHAGETQEQNSGERLFVAREDDILQILRTRLETFERELAAVDSEIRELEYARAVGGYKSSSQPD